MSAPPGTISGEFAGRYTVERELGRGATSIVYLARDLDYGRAVALKVLRTELAESITAERFLREIRLTAQLHHPHIVPVLNSGEDDGRLYFALPYMDGGTLRDRLERDKQLPIPDVIEIGKTVLSALALAHERNLIHRDVKPENILFTGGQACLSDFGIARAMERAGGEGTTSTGLVRGTPAYMSPEQASGDRDYDGRSDLYSLACVLYEALAGVPAFVGATPHQVVAQRLSHEPRGVRVYRPSVSVELEAVLAKALATAPADRFQTATEFADALSAAPLVSSGIPAQAPARKRTLIVAGSISVAVAIAAVAFAMRGPLLNRFASDAALDTARVVVFPFDSIDTGEIGADGLLREEMRRWKGLSVAEPFEVGDAIRQFGYPVKPDQARTIARHLGAGRFIRGTARGRGTGVLVATTLYDTRSGKSLYTASRETGPLSSPDRSGFTELADSLALRGAHTEISTIGPDSSRNLPATQLVIRAGTKLGEWNLDAAESLFVKALEFEPSSARAAYWIAQIRSWRRNGPETWRELASRGASDSASLTPSEQRMAMALDALGRGEYQRACQLYTAATQQRPNDFTAWYGRGECIEKDNVVVPDPRVVSGWRFRSSYRRAIDAYVRAFELMPSAYRNYQGSAYADLAGLLYVNSRTRRIGRDLAGTRSFLGSLAASSDTIAFVVYPMEVAAAGRAGEQPSTAAGISITRTLFHRITSTWASAFPQSAGAKEGLGLSLELRGDAAAIDTVRSALRLARDRGQRTHLLGTLLWLDMKFGVEGDLDLVRDARRSADSALRATPLDSVDRATLEVMARFAAMTGRCETAVKIARRALISSKSRVPVSDRALGETQARLIHSALGCERDGSLQSIESVVSDAGVDKLPENVRRGVIQYLFGREIRSAERFDTTWGTRIAQSGDYLISARLAAARRKPDSARALLNTIRERREFRPKGGIALDAAVPESFTLLALGDSTAALHWLDNALAEARFFPPLLATDADNIVQSAFMLRAIVLRADLARSTRDRRRWATTALTLLNPSEPGLEQALARMRQYARQ